MKRILGVLLLLSFSLKLWACQLPAGEQLVIGSTYQLDAAYRWRLQFSAWRLNYPLKFVQLTEKEADRALEDIDALLIPGGADINPEYYLSQVTPELADYTRQHLSWVNFSQEGKTRDPFEYAVLKNYSEDNRYQKLPLLGICRGMQMMGVAQGIPLYLDIQQELGIKNRYRKFDRIQNIQKNSLMSQIYPGQNLKGFKYHHQGLRVFYYHENRDDFPLARITSYSHNGMIAESLEYSHRPAIGVQYHPEKSLPQTTVPLFKWFLTTACEYKNSLRK
jgi:putative glutamine amidotransferase